jgi:hypothetical protein
VKFSFLIFRKFFEIPVQTSQPRGGAKKKKERDAMRTRTLHSTRCITARRFWLPVGALILALLVLGLQPQPAFAQTPPPSLFQLDGTAASNPSYPMCTYLVGGVPATATCDFWDLLNGSGGSNPTGSAGHSSVRTFISGESSTFAFTGGGSKDPNDISSWSCSSTPTPNKDTLTNGYAAAYTAPNSDLVTVFGADRLSTSGDANIGIWFFQQTVACNPVTGKFTGLHTTGDIFAISAFTVGGTTPTISVFEWQPLCTAGVKSPTPGPIPGSCADTNLELLFSAGSLCDSSGTLSTLAACAITNSANIQVTWPYPTASSATPSTVPAQAFFTGGVDVTNLLKAPVCFTSFLEETRSSQSTTAVLKDFIAGSFPECHLSANKTVTCTTFNAGGSFNYSYSGHVINDGGGNLFNVKVVDVKGQSYSCGNLAVGTSKVFGGVPLSTDCSLTAGSSATFTDTAHPASNQATATADTSPNGSTPPVSADTGAVQSTDAPGGGCTPAPGLAVAKRCVTNFQISGGQIVIRVDYTGEVSNTGNDNLSNVNVAEAANGTPASATFGPFSLIPGQAICYTNGQTVNPGATPPTGCPTLTAVADLTTNPPTNAGAASYTPSGVNILATSAGRIAFSDTVTAAGTDAFGNPVPKSGQPPVTSTAQCVICPFGECAAQ